MKNVMLTLLAFAGICFAQTQPNLAAMKGPNVTAASAVVLLPGGGVTFLTLDMSTLQISGGVLSGKVAPPSIPTRKVETTTLTAPVPTYTLGSTPNATAPELDVFLNGLALSVSIDYTVSGSVVTFIPAVLMEAGDILRVVYRTQ